MGKCKQKIIWYEEICSLSIDKEEEEITLFNKRGDRGGGRVRTNETKPAKRMEYRSGASPQEVRTCQQFYIKCSLKSQANQAFYII